ncbi:MAG: HAMP domain-containing histidine kinase [Firmicutes bacterium]|nr:HAMP domain-containing histidine kinase [Bacillota bacterium]
MSVKKEYILIVLYYIAVAFYIIFIHDLVGSVLLILLLMTFHFYTVYKINAKFNQDKVDSVSKLLSKLDKTKKENDETYKRFISLTTILGSGIIMVNEEGIVNFMNKDIQNYFSINFQNEDYNVLVKVKPLYKFINQAYLLEKSLREQIAYSDHYFDLISTPLFENKMFKGCLIIVHDITLLKTAENFQKQFTADVSHELKTPLSTIKGFSEILERDKNIKPSEREEFISLISKESTRMETILSDLLIISKMDRLDYELTLEEVNFTEVVKENVSILKRQLDAKGLKYSENLEPCSMRIDKNKMGQVVLNLVKNAITYTDSGEITVKGEVKGSNYVLFIQDTGIGITQSDIDKIFKRFYRVDTARSRDSGGSGLGLSICKNVVLKHGGNISVESTVAKGTTFTIIIPIKK